MKLSCSYANNTARAEVSINGRTYIATIRADGVTLREKGKRNGARYAPWYEILGASSPCIELPADEGDR